MPLRPIENSYDFNFCCIEISVVNKAEETIKPKEKQCPESHNVYNVITTKSTRIRNQLYREYYLLLLNTRNAREQNLWEWEMESALCVLTTWIL